MYVKDLDGREYAVMTTFLIEDELNGNVVFSAHLQPNKPNLLFLDDLEKMWRIVDDDNTEYIIVYVKKRGEGTSLSAEIKAIPKFFDDFDNDRVYEEYNRSLTAKAALDIIFKGSGYNYILKGDYDSKDWDGFGGGSTRLEMFKDWLNRYGGEFSPPVGNTVYIDNRVGEDLNVMYRHRLNASNIVEEVDATDFWTYAKGYGDYEGDKEAGDWKDAKLIREYTSPLSKIVGVRHAPPIKDGRIKYASVMDKRLKKLVDESLKISVTADIHDLTRQGYPISQTKNGDRVFLIDERIGLNEEVRVVKRKVLRDWRGKILDIELTFGSQSIVKRHQSNLSNSAKAINEILEGRRKIPFNALSNEVAVVTKAILSAQTELDFENGIIARDSRNPNLVVVLNSAGLGISQDGGRTFKNAITGRGILAEHILAGTITAGGNRRIDIADGSIWSYAGADLTMNFGQYALDFYHYKKKSLFASFGVDYLVDSDIPILSLTLKDRGAFSIGVLVDGITRPAFRLYDYGNYSETMVAGAYRDNTSLGLFASSKLWEGTGSYRHNQASIRLETKDGHNILSYFGRDGSNGTAKFLYNTGDGALKVAEANKEGFWASKYNVGSGQGYLRGYTNAVALEWGTNQFNRILLRDNGQVNLFAGGSIKHSFYPDGTKAGGSIEIDGENLGMSPVDSPQVLIEYIEFDVELTHSGTRIELDNKFRKAVSNFAVFPNNGSVTEKGDSYFILKGEGVADVRIIGKRIGQEKTFWTDMDKEGVTTN